MTIRIDDFGYLNARVRAREAALLDRGHFEILLEAGEVEAVIDFLLNSPYKTDLAEALTAAEGVDAVERALLDNLYRAAKGVLDRAGGQSRQLLLIFSSRWDVFNVKTLLRGLSGRAGKSEILSRMIPAGELSPPVLDRLAEAPTPAELADRLVSLDVPAGSWLKGLLRAARRAGKPDPELPELERGLDRAYFAWGLATTDSDQADARFLGRLLALEIDSVNIVLILRFIRNREVRPQLARHFLPGGRLSPRVLEGLARSERPEEVIERLSRGAFAGVLEKGVIHYFETGRVGFLERLFEEVLLAESRRRAIIRPLSVAVPVRYLLCKKAEMVNLRLITLGIAYRLPRGAIMEEMLLAG